MHRFAANIFVAGVLIAWPSSIYAQSEPPAPAESAGSAALSASTEPSGSTVSVKKTKPAAKTESASQTSTSVKAFVAKLDSGTRAIHKMAKNDNALMRAGCRDLLNDILDLDSMAKATNSEIWERMTVAQRKTVRAAFEQRMIRGCVRQFGGYDGENLLLAGIRSTEGGQLLATVRVGAQIDGKLVTWRLHNSGPDHLRAIDVITDGRSAVSDARNEFAAVLESVNGDIEALIAFMRK